MKKESFEVIKQNLRAVVQYDSYRNKTQIVVYRNNRIIKKEYEPGLLTEFDVKIFLQTLI